MQIRIDSQTTKRVTDTHSTLYTPNIIVRAYQEIEIVHHITEELDTVIDLSTYDSFKYFISETPYIGDVLTSSTSTGINHDSVNGLISISVNLWNDDIQDYLQGKTQAKVYAILYGIKDGKDIVLANYDFTLSNVIYPPVLGIGGFIIGEGVIL